MFRQIDVSFPGGLQVSATINGRVIETDQSVKNGGQGKAPEPFDYFFASIATCAGTYAIEFCIENALSSHGLHLSMECVWNKEKRIVDQMCLKLRLPDGFPSERTQEMLDAMASCTVKRHLRDDIHFSIAVVAV